MYFISLQISLPEVVITIFQEKMIYNEKGYPTICVVDCGLKYNQIRCFLKRNAKVIVVPWDYPFHKEKFHGLFLSNGPGNPELCKSTINNLKIMLEKEELSTKPIFGICLGHQLLAIASGFSTYKMT